MEMRIKKQNELKMSLKGNIMSNIYEAITWGG